MKHRKPRIKYLTQTVTHTGVWSASTLNHPRQHTL